MQGPLNLHKGSYVVPCRVVYYSPLPENYNKPKKRNYISPLGSHANMCKNQLGPGTTARQPIKYTAVRNAQSEPNGT